MCCFGVRFFLAITVMRSELGNSRTAFRTYAGDGLGLGLWILILDKSTILFCFDLFFASSRVSGSQKTRRRISTLNTVCIFSKRSSNHDFSKLGCQQKSWKNFLIWLTSCLVKIPGFVSLQAVSAHTTTNISSAQSRFR